MIRILKKIWAWLWCQRIAFSSFLKISRLGVAGSECLVYPTARIYNGRHVRLGNHVTINDFVHIWGLGGVTIGNDCMIASHCAIISQTHDSSAFLKGLKYRETMEIDRPVKIGDNVWIGAAAVILPGVSIGNDSIVAAGAVVSRDVPPQTLVAGVPARTIRNLAG